LFIIELYVGKRSYYWWLVISDARGVPVIEPKILATMVSCGYLKPTPKILATMVSCEYLKPTPGKQLVMKT
jgi:hypothetical protein